MKRLLDVLASAVGLVVLSPGLFLIALLVKITSNGPIFYRAERLGKHGKNFWLYKFRTMEMDPTNSGPKITVKADPRVTAVGRWLRKFKLDEFPQLVNVLKGEMSLVGPRPEDPSYIAHYSPHQRELLRVAPGITSPASLKFRQEERLLTGEDWEETYVNEILPQKLEIDLRYLQNSNFMMDIWILLRTVGSIFR